MRMDRWISALEKRRTHGGVELKSSAPPFVFCGLVKKDFSRAWLQKGFEDMKMNLIEALEIAVPFLFQVMPEDQRGYWRDICDKTELREPTGAQFLRDLMEKAWADGDAKVNRMNIKKDGE